MWTKEFVTLLVDAVVLAITYFGGKYADKSIFEDIKFVVTLAQPFVVLILTQMLVQRASRYIQQTIRSLMH
jgi:hypothetical protein